MNDRIVKFQMKIGTSEISYEGPPEYLEESLEKVVSGLSDVLGPNSKAMLDSGDTSISERMLGPKNQLMMISSMTCAQRLAVNSGRDLILAGGAKLMLVDQKDSFDRKDLLREMKSASIYYKQSYGTNLSRYLKRLIKDGEINSLSNDKFALSAGKLEELQRIIQTPAELNESSTQSHLEDNQSEDAEG